MKMYTMISILINENVYHDIDINQWKDMVSSVFKVLEKSDYCNISYSKYSSWKSLKEKWLILFFKSKTTFKYEQTFTSKIHIV